MINLNPEQSSQSREKQYEGADRDLYLDLGFFHAWFSLAELAITTMLAIASKATDLKTFDILCKGMDARVKVERLRKLTPVGPNLQARLSRFEKGAIGLRNKLAHRSFGINEDDGPRRYYLSSLSCLPWELTGSEKPTEADDPEVITSSDLHGWGLWLEALTRDFSAASRHAMRTGVFEIVTPKTKVPPAAHPQNPQRDRLSTPDTQPQTDKE